MRLHNTLTRNTDEFQPIEAGKVRLYACGLTVYSQPHIGNWVAYIYWDILVRTLRASGYEVEHVQNITDVGHLTSDEDAGEDKMLEGALKEGKTAWEVADKYIAIADQEAYEQLDLTRPTHLPRATEYIQQQIDFVKILEEKGYTYTIDDGVYFNTSKLDNYGQLARLDIEGLQFGARVEATGKKNPTDFALWKFSPHPLASGQKRDMEWDNPFDSLGRKGFPGWHLECSVMARELLGDTIDIHTGGIDHIPVHHTNEIAQSESVTGKPFSNYWLHANHIKVDGTKMSKSLGNIYTLQDITKRGFDIQAFKLLVLSKHYRTEGNFTWEIMEAANNRLKNWQKTADLIYQSAELANESLATDEGPLRGVSILTTLQNDLDTPKALEQIDSFFSRLESEGVTAENYTNFARLLGDIELMLGLQLRRGDISDQQKQLITERNSAREAKDWAKSDELRDQLKEQGIEVKDTSDRTVWNRS